MNHTVEQMINAFGGDPHLKMETGEATVLGIHRKGPNLSAESMHPCEFSHASNKFAIRAEIAGVRPREQSDEFAGGIKRSPEHFPFVITWVDPVTGTKFLRKGGGRSFD